MKFVTYIGCYSDEKMEAIHIIAADSESGSITPLNVVKEFDGATYLCLNRDHTRLYAGLGVSSLGTRSKNGAVAAFAIEGTTLKLLNYKAVGVTPPCYVALDPQERTVVFAEYTNAVSGVFELSADGQLADSPPVTVQHFGKGPDTKRQERAHAHCAEVSPDGRYLCIVDLGIDQVKIYDYPNRGAGLKELPTMRINSAGGAGPRHLIFHPNGKTAYLLHELNNTISSFRYTGESFILVQTVPMLPLGLKDSSKASAIKFSPDGMRLFGSNRGHESIVTYDIDPDSGKMSMLAINPLAGKFPRDFEFMPGGKFMLVGHETSNQIMTYAYDQATGTITPTDATLPMFRPVYVKFGQQLH